MLVNANHASSNWAQVLPWVPDVFSRVRGGASSAADRHVFGRKQNQNRKRAWKVYFGTQGGPILFVPKTITTQATMIFTELFCDFCFLTEME